MTLVAATYKPDYDDFADAGDFTFYVADDGDKTGILFRCPCGCGDNLGVDFAGEPAPRWTWDGNEARPTISPSIRRVGGCGWHGWLKGGVFESC